MRSAEAVFWCVRDCSRLAAKTSVTAGYYSSVEGTSIGASLKTSRIGLSVLYAVRKADFLRRIPSCLYRVSLDGQAIQARPKGNRVTLIW